MTSRLEWLRLRKQGIGASEAAAVLGLSRFRSPFAIYVDKTTDTIDDSPPNEMAEAGLRMEPVLAKWFEDVVGGDVLAIARYTMAWKAPLFATVDRYWQKPGEPDVGVLELKCAWYDAAKEWDTKLPIAYAIQLQHQLYCTGKQYGAFAVLLNGYQFRHYEVERNERFIGRLVERLTAFSHNHIVARIPPGVDSHGATTAALSVAYPTASEAAQVALDLEFSELQEHIDLIDAKIASLESEKEEARNRIRAAIGDAEYGVLPDGSGYRWQSTKSGRALKRIKRCPTN